MDAAHDDIVVVRNARLAVSRELQKKRVLNQPIARFYVKTKRVYLQHSDGSISDIAPVMSKGRYSERKR